MQLGYVRNPMALTHQHQQNVIKIYEAPYRNAFKKPCVPGSKSRCCTGPYKQLSLSYIIPKGIEVLGVFSVSHEVKTQQKNGQKRASLYGHPNGHWWSGPFFFFS
jgi:hypothetical protein